MVKEEQFHSATVLRKDAEIDPVRKNGGTQWIASACCVFHGVFPSL
jgi:hypothetical protein